MAVLANLQDIRNKVRRLTRSPSQQQMTDAQLDDYINTFILYDFPEHLRTFNLREQFTFICNPFQDVYYTDTASFGGVTTNPLYNFQNLYLTVHPPVYIAGFDSFYTQSREQFFGIYPLINSIASIGTAGNGVTTNFAGVVNTQQANVPPNFNQLTVLIKNQVLFDSVDANGNGTSLVDSPILDATTGNPTVYGLMYDPNNVPANLPLVLAAPYTAQVNFPANNFINYETGQFNITFTGAPGAGVPINSQTVPSVLALPQAMLFYQNQFILRPVPDQPYRINFEVYVRPTALLQAGDVPTLQEYWQYIAYGAAKKRFEDQMDLDSVALIMPEFKVQERLCLRRTIVQYTNERVATIYTEQTNVGNGYNGWWGGGNGA